MAQDMILYTFIFLDEDGNEFEQEVWAHFEREAREKADSIAYRNGYIDFILKE